MKNYAIYISLYFCLSLSFSSFSQQGCYISPDTRTLAQLFYKKEQVIKAVFNCKIISNSITSGGYAYSIAEIKEVYFGKTNLKKIQISIGYFPPPAPPPLLLAPVKPKIKTNYDTPHIYDLEGVLIDPSGPYQWGVKKLLVDSTYLIYVNSDTSYHQNYIGRSKPLKATPAIKNEIETLKTFDEIFKQKKTGHYVFKNVKGIVIGIGRYKKGELFGVWKNYDDNGRLASFEEFQKGVYKTYYLNGNLNEKIIKYKDSTITENYFDSSKQQLVTRIINIKNDSGSTSYITGYDRSGFVASKHQELTYKMTCLIGLYWEYYPNGKVKIISEYNFHAENYRCGIYKQYYPSGNLKLDAHIYNARRVGCWIWYNDDGTFWAEWDYKDGKAPQ